MNESRTLLSQLPLEQQRPLLDEQPEADKMEKKILYLTIRHGVEWCHAIGSVDWALSLSPSLTHRKDHRKIIEIIAIIMGASAVSDVKCFIRHRQLAGMNYRMRSPSLFRTQPLSLEWASRIKMKIPYLFLV